MATPNPPTLISTSPGGEQTQYEGSSTFQTQSNKSRGTLAEASDPSTVAPSSSETSAAMDSNKPFMTEEEKRERGEKTAENVRFGQAVSEQGIGGKTEGLEGGSVEEGAGYGRGKADEDAIGDVAEGGAREASGYGEGSDVGA